MVLPLVAGIGEKTKNLADLNVSNRWKIPKSGMKLVRIQQTMTEPNIKGKINVCRYDIIC